MPQESKETQDCIDAEKLYMGDEGDDSNLQRKSRVMSEDFQMRESIPVDGYKEVLEDKIAHLEKEIDLMKQSRPICCE